MVGESAATTGNTPSCVPAASLSGHQMGTITRRNNPRKKIGPRDGNHKGSESTKTMATSITNHSGDASPPYSEKCEQAALGLLLTDPANTWTKFDACGLTAEWFY